MLKILRRYLRGCSPGRTRFAGSPNGRMKYVRAGAIVKFLLELTTVLSFGSAAYADVVTQWNTAALNVIRTDRTPPPEASRALAILHASIYDAVNGIARRHEPYLVQSVVPSSASKDAA